MRKFAVLGASALVLALGVAQASALPAPQWTDGYTSDNAGVSAPQREFSLGDFRAQVDVRAQAPVISQDANQSYFPPDGHGR